MLVEPVDAQVHVVEPAAGRPQFLRAHADRGHAGGLCRFAEFQEVVPVLRRRPALSGENVLAIEEAPENAAKRQTILLAVDGDGRHGGAQLIAVALLYEEVGNVVEQSAVDESLHSVTGEPEADVRGAHDQVAADGRLVGLVIHIVDGDFRSRPLGKVGRNALQDRPLIGIADIRDDGHFAAIGNCRAIKGRSRQGGARTDHELAPRRPDCVDE